MFQKYLKIIKKTLVLPGLAFASLAFINLACSQGPSRSKNPGGAPASLLHVPIAGDFAKLLRNEVSNEDHTIKLVKQECGIDLIALSGDGVKKPLLRVQKPLALKINDHLEELTSLLLSNQKLTDDFLLILRLASLVTGLFTLDADMNINIDASMSGSNVKFSGHVAKLSLDLLENSSSITNILTKVGNDVAGSILNRSIKSEFMSLEDRVKTNDPHLMNTLCTLLVTKKMTIESKSKTTLLFNPPIPTIVSPFAKDSVYDDQLGDIFTTKSMATIETTDNSKLNAGSSFEITATVTKLSPEKLSYCGPILTDTLVYRLTLSASDPALLSTIGILPQLDFYKNKNKVGAAPAAIGIDPGISIVKKPFCIII